MKTSFAAVFYDMDGVLVDSEIHWDTAIAMFFESRGVPYSKELKRNLSGKGFKQNMEWAKLVYGWNESVEVLVEEYAKQSEVVYETHATPLPGVVEVLRLAKGHHYKTAIASAATLPRIEKIVERFSWQPYFDALISVDHVGGVGKPAPDVYLHAAKVLGVEPEECVVIEDSENGVRAAKAAGMTCIAVPDPRWSHGAFDIADIICTGFNDPEFRATLSLPL
jgi:HAD superfamily hydrolase (TIGR01509 family)